MLQAFYFPGSGIPHGKPDDQRPVTVLRDTGGSGSFILASVLPLNPQSARDVSAVVRGIGMSFVPAPLHSIHVQSKLVSGFFPVAVRSHFPVDGVDFILGNDIAGGKVFPDPEVVDTPIPEVESDELVQKHPGVFSVSVLTRAQACKQTQGVDLSDSLFPSVFREDQLPSSGGAENRPTQVPVNAASSVTVPEITLPLTCKVLINAQQSDSSLAKCLAAAGCDASERASQQHFLEDEVLMRKWVPHGGTADLTGVRHCLSGCSSGGVAPACARAST